MVVFKIIALDLLVIRHCLVNCIFLIFAQNVDCVYTLEPLRQGGSNEYPQSMFWSKNKKTKVYPCILQFCYIKVGFKGVYFTWTCFRDVCHFR